MDLVEQVLRGNPKAVEKLYRTFAPDILRYLKRKLPREEDAQEILNDVFLDAIDALTNLRDHTHLKSWLYQIAHNKIANFYRKRKIKSFLFSQFTYLKLVAIEIHEPEFQYERHELLLKLKNTIKQLSQKYQDILHMHYEEEMPINAIASQLNLSPKATESLLFRARKQFIKQYERT